MDEVSLDRLLKRVDADGAEWSHSAASQMIKETCPRYQSKAYFKSVGLLGAGGSIPATLCIRELTEDQECLKMTPGQGVEPACMMQVSGSSIISTDPSVRPKPTRLSALAVQFRVVSNSEAARGLD